jgi:WD40-like Beta Propeller Repeat
VTVEDRLRETAEAVAAAMRPVRPLDLRPDAAGAPSSAGRRSPRQWPGWLFPLAAAMAVIAVAATLVAVKGVSDTRPVTPTTLVSSSASVSAAAPSGAVPRYYVSLGPLGANGAPTQNAVLADAATGKQLATFSPPAHDVFSYTAAAADDATFVLLAAPKFGAITGKAGTDTWYVLRVAPGAPQKARLTPVPIAALPAGTSAIGLAVSPDGRTLAGLFQTISRAGTKKQLTYRLSVRTYSLATGQALRTWTDPAGPLTPTGPGTFNISWLNDGRTLAFAAATRAAPQGIRFLNTAGPGSSLISDSRLVFSAPATRACSSVLLSADGQAVICGSYAPSPAACAGGQLDVTAYSVATGKLERVLYRYRGGCQPSGTAQVIWSGSGTSAIGAIFVGSAKENRVGLMAPGTFGPVAIPSNGGDYAPGSIAF